MEKIFQILIQLCLTSLWLAVVVNPAMAGGVQSDSVKDSMAISDSESAVPAFSPSLQVVNKLISNTDEDGSKDVSAGDTLNYSIVATNTGTANLTNVTVEDDLTGDSTSCALVLAADNNDGVAGTCVLKTTYVVTAVDVLAGSVKNIGTGDYEQTPPVDDPEEVPVPTPSLSVDMQLTNNADEDGSGDASVGDTLTYTIEAENNGTANLTNVTVDDD